ncbi:ubiquitin-like protein Pup [Streptomyces sp. NPDC060028]|uniref:ubiquitin-like protein Pup n=1 Tax=Streptomyces sp. NPDC060028 TaxID=3347041 RepID=UPI0036BFA154
MIAASISVYSRSTVAGIVFSIITTLALLGLASLGAAHVDLFVDACRRIFSASSPTPVTVGAGDSRAVDDILHEIDDVVSSDEMEFVTSFVQKGGQGWSGLLEPSFFIGVVSVSVTAGMPWVTFKKMMSRLLLAIDQIPGPSNAEALLRGDGTLDENFEEMLHAEWRSAEYLLDEQPPKHSLDEAAALHWVLFYKAFTQEQHLIQIRADQYQEIKRVAAAGPEYLEPNELLERILSQWINDNPSTDAR